MIQFWRENERVEGNVATDAAAMKKLHQLRQVGDCEIVGPHSGVETFEAEIDGVGAVFDGRFGAFPIAGRREQLRPNQRRRLGSLGCGLIGGHQSQSVMDQG